MSRERPTWRTIQEAHVEHLPAAARANHRYRPRLAILGDHIHGVGSQFGRQFGHKSSLQGDRPSRVETPTQPSPEAVKPSHNYSLKSGRSSSGVTSPRPV